MPSAYNIEHHRSLAPSDKGCLRITTALGLFLIVITVLLWSAISVSHESTSTKLQIPQPLNCGNSSSEARDLGCKFDVISFSWLPPSCYDSSLSSAFASLGTESPSADTHLTSMSELRWSWYLNANGTDP